MFFLFQKNWITNSLRVKIMFVCIWLITCRTEQRKYHSLPFYQTKPRSDLYYSTYLTFWIFNITQSGAETFLGLRKKKTTIPSLRFLNTVNAAQLAARPQNPRLKCFCSRTSSSFTCQSQLLHCTGRTVFRGIFSSLYLASQTPSSFLCKNHIKSTFSCPGWCGSVDWVPACEPKGHWINSQSGRMPVLQARSPVGDVQEATHWCFSPSLSPSLPLS